MNRAGGGDAGPDPVPHRVPAQEIISRGGRPGRARRGAPGQDACVEMFLSARPARRAGGVLISKVQGGQTARCSPPCRRFTKNGLRPPPPPLPVRRRSDADLLTECWTGSRASRPLSCLTWSAREFVARRKQRRHRTPEPPAVAREPRSSAEVSSANSADRTAETASGYDISTSGTEQVASLVVWKRREKKATTSGTGSSVTGGDDFASLRELLTRRFSRASSRRACCTDPDRRRPRAVNVGATCARSSGSTTRVRRREEAGRGLIARSARRRARPRRLHCKRCRRSATRPIASPHVQQTLRGKRTSVRCWTRSRRRADDSDELMKTLGSARRFASERGGAGRGTESHPEDGATDLRSLPRR